MSSLSRSEQMVAEKTVCILLVRGQNPDGGNIYAYVAVRADMLEEFMKAQESGLFYPEDFGVVVKSGEGEPTPEDMKFMEEEYGFNHQAMVTVPNADEAKNLAASVAASAKTEGEDGNQG